VALSKNMTPNALAKMYLITLKVFKICLKMLAPITKVNEGELNTPCPSTLELVTLYSSR
jgi:hypothetical protein